MKINVIFVFYTHFIYLTQRDKRISIIEAASNCSRHEVKYANRDTTMKPFTPKTDHNLNSSHKINTPTNMVSIRIRENLNWRTVFY